MGKYSEIVKGKNQAAKPENQKAINIESSKSGKPENIITSNTESNKTSKLENVKAREPAVQKTETEDMVNLSIKVPRRLRQKWVAESRLRGTTLTAIISDYLKAELGG